MRVLVSWSKAAECLSECARQSIRCGVSVCERFAVAHHLLSQPYPPLDVVLAAPTYARRCWYLFFILFYLFHLYKQNKLFFTFFAMCLACILYTKIIYCYKNLNIIISMKFYDYIKKTYFILVILYDKNKKIKRKHLV